MTDWMPIETAPKDEAVLIYTGSVRMIARQIFYGPLVGYRWMIFGRFSKVIPTHWMPLPAPPGPAA